MVNKKVRRLNSEQSMIKGTSYLCVKIFCKITLKYLYDMNFEYSQKLNK